MTALQRMVRLFSISASSPRLVTAQLQGLQRQMPFLYLLLTINAATLAYTHLGIAPAPLVLVPVAMLEAICIVRAIVWMKLDVSAIPLERHLALLRRTQRLTVLLSAAILLWSLTLSRYGGPASSLYVFFFLAMTSTGCIYCLTHLRSAALVVAIAVIVPTAASAIGREGAVPIAMAINLILAGGIMLIVLSNQHGDFLRLVEQNEMLESMGRENFLLASIDMLTGLPNRRSFLPSLERAILNARQSSHSCLLGIIDLDGFKGINDIYGHVAGDSVLVEVAQRLRRAVPADASLARLGGDEFGLILPNVTDASELDRISRDIATAIAPPLTCVGTSVRLGASIGYAGADGDTEASTLVERADFALYEAKAQNRGTWVRFTEEHGARMRLRCAVEDSLRHADLSSELSLVFQPIVDVAMGRTVAFEALARWRSPILGDVPPDRFIAIAERAGLVGELTTVLLAEALRNLADWPVDVALSFNLSMLDVTTPDAISRICDMVHRSGIAPERVHFEVTETAMLVDFEKAESGLTRLKEIGTRLSLDDFGTGYSSLSHLHRLPVDRLKVDQSFTRELLTSTTARSIVASTLTLARNLGLHCVVEGVESEDQEAVLRTLGAHLMQGYLFQKPMVAEAVSVYLQREIGSQTMATSRQGVPQRGPRSGGNAVLQSIAAG